MNGTNQSNVHVTLRNPLDHSDQLTYTINVFDNPLASDWVIALKKLLQSQNLLEKNYCFMGFPKSARTLSYLCSELNISVFQINMFNASGAWQAAGELPYIIEEYYSPDSVRFGPEYPIAKGGTDTNQLGLDIKHNAMNILHLHFERLQGTVSQLSRYYILADYETKYAIRQLNILCHEIESLVMSERKVVSAPQWQRPSQITTFLHADRSVLTTAHRDGFSSNGYDRRFGHVYMHWAQIGKTLFEVFRDENAPTLDLATCSAINQLEYFSGEFDIEWGLDVLYNTAQFPWHTIEQDEFKKWLEENGLDPTDPLLSLGHLPIGEVDLHESFGTQVTTEIWDQLSSHLDIYKIEVDGISNIYNYCWTDADYKQQQINMMRPGYDFSSRGR
jgi:hypothetical protein